MDLRAAISAGLALLFVMCVAGCADKKEDYSPLFNEIVQPEKGGTFRGIDLGMKISDVLAKEHGKPAHDDAFGLAFLQNLGEGREFHLEYLSKPQAERVVNSIVGNVILKDAAETSDFYGELESFWRMRYGVADGPIGNIQWKDAEAEILLSLRILEDKKSISFNFVPVSGF